jgi:hypothetical protein
MKAIPKEKQTAWQIVDAGGRDASANMNSAAACGLALGARAASAKPQVATFFFWLHVIAAS